MVSVTDKFTSAIERFDAANRADPNTEEFEGRRQPRELVYAERMTRWLERLAPDASEVLRLAARCQHIRRWTIARSDYPQTRAGYHQWRNTLARFHADKAGEILKEVGYDADTITRVQDLVLKKNLRNDPETQLLEDVICVVFLENYFAEFSGKHEEGKIITIIRKTWKKMTPRGQQAAMALQLSPQHRALIAKALG